jgi:hypothetical protein
MRGKNPISDRFMFRLFSLFFKSALHFKVFSQKNYFTPLIMFSNAAI